MKRTILTIVAVSAALGTIASGCLDRKPAPVCPVPIEIAKNSITASEFDGVDMLVVVDNSGSMAEEQAILSTGFFTLINSLTKPLLHDPSWTYPAVDNMRVAITTSDLGLSYGENRETAASPTDVGTCGPLGVTGNVLGDNGNFLLGTALNIDVQSDTIRCEQDGGQCPAEFDCNNFGADGIAEMGRCMAPSGVPTVACPAIDGNSFWAETTSYAANPDLTTQVACMGMQGTKGCGFEQQLEAAVVGLSSHTDFLQDSHLLAVLIVSDEEDCSIENPALFSTTEWITPQLQNTACNISPANEENLFATTRYKEKFLALKNNQGNAVIFAAIVGVPTAEESAANGWPLCEGLGTEIAECLDPSNAAMTIESMQFTDPNNQPYTHFAPACVRENPANPDVPFTEARPGRRYVSVAREFETSSYVYSICNEDWSQAMRSIAEIIAKQISSSCYPKKLEWTQLPANEQPATCTNQDCGEAECDVVVKILRGVGDDQKCPDEYYADLTDDEKRAYTNKKAVEPVTGANGQITQYNVLCPLPKIATPRSCSAARGAVDDDVVGWYYCEETSENFYSACNDGNDNDGDGFIDANDEECQRAGCDQTPPADTCDQGSCSYGVEITSAGKDVSRGNPITVMCLQQFSFEDENCQEDSPSACYDAKDNIDEDGNGVWNCTIGKGDNIHSPDPNCCPMDYRTTAEGQKICEPDVPAVVQNCKKGMANHSDVPITLDQSNWREVPACIEHARALGCTMQ